MAGIDGMGVTRTADGAYEVARETVEARVALRLDLGQRREPRLATTLAFFDHTLEMLSWHAGVNARAMPSGGAIVLNSSASGLDPEENLADCNCSKAGVAMLGRTLARKLGSRGFWVTVVCPGYVRTRMTAPYLDDPATRSEILPHIPSGRVGDADEAAALVSFRASPEASYMNGSVVTIDGGRLA